MSKFKVERIFPVEHQTLKANGTFLYDGVFSISFTLVKGGDGLFVSLPRREYTTKDGEKKWQNLVFCGDEDTRAEMTEAVMTAYQQLQNGEFQGQQKKSGGGGGNQKKKSSVPF